MQTIFSVKLFNDASFISQDTRDRKILPSSRVCLYTDRLIACVLTSRGTARQISC